MAANKGKFTLSVLDEKGVVYYGDCSILFIKNRKETVAILPEHTPMIMKLEPGSLGMRLDHDTSDITPVQSGVVYVAEGEVTVLVNL